MEERKRDIYGDNFLDDYSQPWESARFVKRERINPSAVVYGVGLALSLTFVALVLGFVWSQYVESVVVNYSFLVDLTLAGAVLIGAYKGAVRAKTQGLAHGALIGAGYSITGLIILAVVASINWLGALETIVVATFLGGIGGVVGINVRASGQRRPWGSEQPWGSNRNWDSEKTWESERPLNSEREQHFPDYYDDFLPRL